jgi:hypothetical protein
VQVHHADDEDDLAADLVDHPVGESVRPAAAGALRQGLPRLGKLADALERPLDFDRELESEPFALGIQIGDGLTELRLGGGDERDGPDPVCRLISSKTSLAGYAGIFPAS